MGSGQFRFIRSDGSRPEMTVGGDISAYQKNLILYKDAWKLMDDLPVVEAGTKVSDSILAQIQTAYLRGRWPSRSPRLINSN